MHITIYNNNKDLAQTVGVPAQTGYTGGFQKIKIKKYKTQKSMCENNAVLTQTAGLPAQIGNAGSLKEKYVDVDVNTQCSPDSKGWPARTYWMCRVLNKCTLVKIYENYAVLAQMVCLPAQTGFAGDLKNTNKINMWT